MDLKRLLGLRPPIKCQVDTEVGPWSPTVVNINRMRAKAWRKKKLIIGGVVVMLVLCLACGAYANFYTNSRKAPPPVQAAPLGMAADLIRTPTPPPGWTAVPGQPQLSYTFATFTPAPPLP